MAAPDTEVVRSFDIRDRGHGREVVLRHRFRSVRRSFYVRARGTDRKLAALGSIEPLPDRRGVDPWGDLWFYANPIFVDVS